MRRVLPFLLLLLACEDPSTPAGRSRTPGADASPITFDRIAKVPAPGWSVPKGFGYSPDGKLVTYLASEKGDDEQTLFAFDVATKTTTPLLRGSDLVPTAAPMSREEELRRERQRQRNVGITSYAWAKKAPVMVVPYAGDIFVRSAEGKVDRLTTTKEPELDPQICSTGERIAFLRGSELGVIDVKSKKETMLTSGAPDGVTRGQSDFNGQEELDEDHGFFWSPSCDRLYFLEVDERQVAEIPVLGWRDGKTDLMMQRYPEAGGKNPIVKAGFIDVATKKITWISWSDDSERYLVRPTFSKDGKSLWLQALSRDQKKRTLVKVDTSTGKTEDVQVDTSPAHVDPAPFELLADGYVYGVVRDGHDHLDLHRAGSARPLTSGDWDVSEIVAVDEEKQRVLFVGNQNAVLERQLFSVPVSGGALTKLTDVRGVHKIRADETGRRWVDVHSARNRLPRVDVYADDRKAAELPATPEPELASLKLQEPELVQVKSPGGQTLYGLLWKPREDGQKHAAVVNVYGGPWVQLVDDSWAPSLFHQHLAQRGFYVLMLDNRGSKGRGPAFEQLTQGKLGKLELEDQVAGVDWLVAHHPVDPKRIGIRGGSYGGMMTVRAMLRAPDKFAVGVAHSSVTDQALYDTAYTERYMGMPQANPDGYRDAQLWRSADQLKGKLFLIAGNMDENVHYTNTALLIDGLIAANKTFDLLALPGERHGVRNPKTNAYVYQRTADYFANNL